MVEWACLENRCPSRDREFESHPHRKLIRRVGRAAEGGACGKNQEDTYYGRYFIKRISYSG